MIDDFDEIENILNPAIPIPPDMEPELQDILPRGYLSVSQVTTVLKCAYSWYLRYVEGKKSRNSIRPFQGIQVHKAVEKVLEARLYKGELPPLEMATDAFSTEFDKQAPMIDDWEGQDKGLAKDTGVLCTKVFYQEAAVKATPVLVEKTFHTVVRTADGKVSLPILGRIDNIQVQSLNEKEYQDIRAGAVANIEAQRAKNPRAVLKTPPLSKPARLHDLKVVTDKWSETDLVNDLQFAIYAGVEHIPDVQVDMLVKGRAKVPRPRYEQLTGVMTNAQVQYAVRVVEDVARTIGLGHFSRTNPDNWWCSEKFCSMWAHCRGAK